MSMPLLKITTTDEEGCAYISEKIRKLITILESGLSFGIDDIVDLYTFVFDMCTKRGAREVSQPLYDHYKKLLEEYIESIVLPSLREKHEELFLREFVKRYVNYNVVVKWILRFFEYIDRYFIPRNNLPTLKEVGLTLFRDKVFDESKRRATDTVIALIERERGGEQIDHGLIKQVLGVFLEVGGVNNMEPYENDFEAHMLENTASYYSRKASNHIYIDSFLEYMLMAEKCLKSEKNRASHYLHSSSKDKLLKKTHFELLLANLNQLIENQKSGLHVWLRDGEVEHLERMFNLFSMTTGGLDPFAILFEKHVTEIGMTLVKEAENATCYEKGFVRKAIELQDKYMGYVKNCFMDHALFAKALKEAFETFCNKSIANIYMPEFLATSCDNLLKKGGGYEKLSNDAIKEMLEKVVMLLTYVHEKDLFAKFCRKKLTRRLLFYQIAGDDHEMFFLSKLKQQWGTQFTLQMEGMLADFKLAREDQKNFENYLVENLPEKPQIRLKATILTSAFWPTYKPSDLHIPAEMRKSIEVFNKFYESKANHRKLTWIYSLGTCNMIGRFRRKSFKLRVTTFQATTLLLFNTSDRLSYQDIKSLLNLTDDDVTRLLHSLSCAKYKILKKEPDTETVSSTDTFEFNAMFTTKTRKIEIPLAPVAEKKVLQDVNTDRRYTIGAAVVRIMKSRKTLAFQQLVTDCVELLNPMFKPDVTAIKKQIENLIEEEYIARSEDDPDTLVYLP